ncbi:MAG: PKD domain-containing protein [Bacteroidota bacterium]
MRQKFTTNDLMHLPIRFSLLAPCLPLLFFALLTANPHTVRACALSEVSLDSIVPVGNEFEIYVTLCVGGGITGTTTGANNATRDFAFGFYSSCTPAICFTDFTPTAIGDTTGGIFPGIDVGPFPGIFQTQGTIGYLGLTNDPYTCVNSTVICGRVHQQCDQFFFRLNTIPDSIRVFGIEGAGNPAAGCYPNADMLIDFTSGPTGGVCCNDSQAPQLTCPSADTLQIAASGCTASLPDYRSVVTILDNCDSDPALVQIPMAGTPLGPGSNNILVFGEDCTGNTDSCTIVITAQDTTAPTAVCQDVTLALGALGSVNLLPSDINAGSSDNCGLLILTANPPSFICPNQGTNAAVLTVTDSASNTSACTSIVTVVDTLPPVAICDPITLYLNGSGLAALQPTQAGGASFDNCSAVGISVTQTAWTCADLGVNSVSVLITDAQQNIATCVSPVTVLDTLAPNLICPADTTLAGLNTPQGCGTFANWNAPVATDNCAAVSLVSNVSPGTYLNPGPTPVSYLGSDSSGNQDSCSFVVTVTPALPTAAFTPNLNAPLSYQFIDGSSAGTTGWLWDFGDGATSTQVNPFHTYASPGLYTVCLTVTDACGTDSTCQPLQVLTRVAAPTAPQIRLYPNPNPGRFSLVFGQAHATAQITVHDLTGRQLAEWTLDAPRAGSAHPFALGNLAAGSYFVKVQFDEGLQVLRFQVQ